MPRVEESSIGPTSIDDVLTKLDEIIETCRQETSRLGYFAALYRHMTARVKAGMAAGLFADSARMERLDITFAQRYITAWEQHRRGEQPSASWAVAFAAAERRRLIIVQLTARVEDEIGQASPWFARLSRLGGRTDTVLVGFSMTLARDDAWAFAQKLAAAPPQQQTLLIAERDKNVARLGELVEHPPGLLVNAINLLIWSREVKNPAIATALLADRARTLAEAEADVARDAAATWER